MSSSELFLYSTESSTFDDGFLSSGNESSTLSDSNTFIPSYCSSSIHVNDQPPDKRSSTTMNPIAKKRKLNHVALFPALDTSTSACVPSTTNSHTTALLNDDMVLQELSLFIKQNQPPSPPLSPSSFDDDLEDFVLFP